MTMQQLVRDARVLYDEPKNLDEARFIEANFLLLENEALEHLEGGVEEKWWK